MKHTSMKDTSRFFLAGRVTEKIIGKVHNATWPHKLLLSSVFALATAYSAQLKIFLPSTPVPITLQTFVVLASGIVLGRWWGSFSQLLYVASGAFGLPLFAGMAGGLGLLVGPRGGYLVGFILTSFLVGSMRRRNFLRTFFSITFVYALAIYGLGCLHLGLWFWFAKGTWPSLFSLFMMGVAPFLFGDLIKIALASLLASRR